MGKPSWVKIVRLLVTPVIALVLAGVAATTSFGLMGSLDSYKPTLPFERITADANLAVPPTSLAPSRSTRRVLLVVVDGLRADTSDHMPYLNELRQIGYAGRMMVSQPSYSKPGYAAIATGATQEISGVVLNSHVGVTPAETIFQVAALNGLRTAAVADSWWEELCGPAVTYPHYYADATFDDPATDQNTTAAAIASLSNEAADLTLVHFAATDTEAHETGGAASQTYAGAAARIDGFIRDIAAQLDFDQDTIIVTADHGHLARNMGPGSGHGGWEVEVTTVPLVAAGAGIRPGKLEQQIPAVDLTATVSALLGMPAPAESQGRILFSMLSIGQLQKAGLAIGQAKRQAILAPAYGAMFGAAGGTADAHLDAAITALTSEDFTAAISEAEASVDASQAAMTTARRSAASRSRSARTLLALVELLVLAAAFYGAGRLAGKGRRWLPIGAGALYLLLDWTVYRGVMRATYSLGALTGSDIASMLRLFALPAYIAALVVLVGALALFRPTERAQRVAVVEATLAGCIGAGFVLAIFGLWQHGTAFQPLLPDFRIAFITLTYMLKGTFLAALMVLLPALAAVWPARRAGESSESDAVTSHR